MLTYLASINTDANDNGTTVKHTNVSCTEYAIDMTIPIANAEIDWIIIPSGDPIAWTRNAVLIESKCYIEVNYTSSYIL